LNLEGEVLLFIHPILMEMDDAQKIVLKGKFIRLVILLNLDVLFFFLAAILYFLLLDKVQYGMVLTVLFLVLALVLGILFVRRYRETKAWLDEHAQTD
jgi:membrane protein implicated in regulation of membrane protease activity